MADYSSYTEPKNRNRGSRTRSETPQQRAARKIDPDDCPSGWDPDVWGLALYFEQKAEGRGVGLAAGRPVIYAMLEKRVRESGIRDATEAQRKDSRGDVRPWRDLVMAMIDHYWALTVEERLANQFPWDEHAASHFTSFGTFRQMGREVRERARNRRLSAELKRRPKQEQEPRRRRA